MGRSEARGRGPWRASRLAAWLATSALVTFAGFARADEPELGTLFESALACELIRSRLADMPVAPIFETTDAGCVPSVPDERRGATYFADAACTRVLPFAPTTLAEHCATLVAPERIGEDVDASTAADGTPLWTLPPGTRFDLGARTLEGVVQPWLQRLIYRDVETPRGRCRLGLRVYARHPDTRGQRSLIAFHGGSWSARGFGFLGLELTVPHFVERGFVVYAPFYRLLGDAGEGDVACREAGIEDIVDDAVAALRWVQENAARFDSDGPPVVFGQSAGAHLALRLGIEYPDELAGVVAFYPPTDFTDFVERAANGVYTDPQGLGVLEELLGVSPVRVDVDASPVPENSFPLRVARDGARLPPTFLLHGQADTLVEARQSVRLCDALAGRALDADSDAISPATGARRERRPCGESSELQLVREGRHALDVCVQGLPLASDLCLSGSEASRREVAAAIGAAAVFAETAAERGVGDGAGGGAGDGAGSDGGEQGGDSSGEEGGVSRTGGGGGGADAPIALLAAFGIVLARRRARSDGADVTART